MHRFVHRFVSIGALVLLVATSTSAQSKEETEFRQAQAKKLVAFAEKALKKGFPRKAKLVFLMVLSEYDPDNAGAHKALGHVRSGSSWVPKEGFRFPTEDKPNPSAAKALRKDYLKLSEDLVRAHKDMARSYEKAGRTDMAQFHYRRILRFAPDDQDAKKHLELVSVADGLSGTSMEQDLYKRGIMIDDAVKQQGTKDYQVERLPDTDRNQLLDNAHVEYISVKSEHFILRGDHEEEILKEAAVWAERAYRVVQVAYKGYEEMFRPDPKTWHITQYSFFKSGDTYKQILNANRGLIRDAKMFQFLIEHTGTCSLGNIRIATAPSKKNVNDGAVRSVAGSFSSFGCDALKEGIGHTFVGLMLRNNRSFIVDLLKQLGTATEEEEIDKFSPDMDMWEDLAIEQAWSKTTTLAVQLPLIDAAKFNDEMRIKSWSFCHYLVLRDPALLRYLDSCLGKKNVIDIEKHFTQHAKVSLEQLDKEWKDYFTGATPVLRAIKHRRDPMTAVSPNVKKWLDAINTIRKKDYHAAPVTWSSRFSARCKDHADYLLENKLSGPEQEQKQDPSLPKSTHPGNMFAQMAMVSTNAKSVKKTIGEWMQYPGYRDLFFVNTLKTVGIYADGDVVVINATQGLVNPRRPQFYMYPRSGSTRVPTQVEVEDLGPELKALLEKHGHGGKKVVGFPLSMHFGNSGRMPKRDSIKCKVTVNDRTNVDGVLHIADDGNHRRTASPGLVVFYPLEPIRKGAQVRVDWTFENGNRLERFDATYHH